MTSCVIVDFGEHVFISGATKQECIGNGLFGLHASDAMDDIPG